jgi:putative transposase
MTLFLNKYRIESARLAGWDYSAPGYYFITVCTHNHGNLFEIRRELVQDEFVVMPNHFHGIVRLVNIARRKRIIPN